MQKLALNLEGLSCPVCTEKLGDMLNKMEGVEQAEAFFNTSKVKVSYDESNVSAEAIIKAIEDMGYTVKQK